MERIKFSVCVCARARVHTFEPSCAPASPPPRPGKGVRLTQQEGPQGLTSPRRQTRPQTPACRWGVCLSLLPGPHPLQGAGSLWD